MMQNLRCRSNILKIRFYRGLLFRKPPSTVLTAIIFSFNMSVTKGDGSSCPKGWMELVFVCLGVTTCQLPLPLFKSPRLLWKSICKIREINGSKYSIKNSSSLSLMIGWWCCYMEIMGLIQKGVCPVLTGWGGGPCTKRGLIMVICSAWHIYGLKRSH